MRTSDRTFILVSIYIISTAMFYSSVRWFGSYFTPRLPRYYPLDHCWRLGKLAGHPSQGWYGMQAFAFIMAAIVTFNIYVLLVKPAANRGDLKPGTIKLLSITTVIAMIYTLSHMVWHEFHHWGIF